MKTLRLLLVLLGLAAISTPLVAQADRATFQGILVAGSNAEGQTDRRLAPYEGHLKRMLPFKSYRFVGEGSAAMEVPGRAAMNVGRGVRLDLAAAPAGGNRVRVDVDWPGVVNTALVLSPGAHTVLGGADAGNGETLAVIFIRR